MATGYALIRWGGTVIGQRPRTRLAVLEGRRVMTWNGYKWVRCHQTAEEVTIYHRWLAWPSAQEIARVKRQLAPLVCTHPRQWVRLGVVRCYICNAELPPEKTDAQSGENSDTDLSGPDVERVRVGTAPRYV